LKLIEENIGKRFQDRNIGNDFFNKTPKTQATKTKTDMWNYTKLRSFYTE
jgi:hypothetical protein